MPTATPADFILGNWEMRQGDRLPMLGLILESDTGVPLDLTGAVCTLMLRHEDGLDALTIEHPGISESDGWLHLPAYPYDPPNGVVLYDWPLVETEHLQTGVLQLMVEAYWPATGERATVPTDRSARLLVRSNVLRPAI